MIKIFIIHGFNASPNSSWMPWLMSELKKIDVYACALAMSTPDNPVCSEWVEEIKRHVERCNNDEVYLVGHSLGVAAILRYLGSTQEHIQIKGGIFISGHSEKNSNDKLDSFLDAPFDFKTIKSRVQTITVIHSDNDPFVPISNAESLSKVLDAKLVIIPNGGHFTGREGWRTFPQCLDALKKIMEVS